MTVSKCTVVPLSFVLSGKDQILLTLGIPVIEIYIDFEESTQITVMYLEAIEALVHSTIRLNPTSLNSTINHLFQLCACCSGCHNNLAQLQQWYRACW